LVAYLAPSRKRARHTGNREAFSAATMLVYLAMQGAPA
jgi:hypothetical protein